MADIKELGRIPGDYRLPRLPGLSALKGGTAFDDEDGEYKAPHPADVKGAVFDESEDQVDLILRRMGNNSADAPLAKRILGWMQTEIPNATLPEAIVYDYLKRNKYVFRYQEWVQGGRAAKGGIVPDFLVMRGGEWLVWNVNGEYWHSQEVNHGKDQSQQLSLVGAIVMGMKIAAYVELWENDLYDRSKRDNLWMLAYAGRGLRG